MEKGVRLVDETDEVPEPFESYEEYRSFMLDYRDLLCRVVKLAASLLPEQALQVALPPQGGCNAEHSCTEERGIHISRSTPNRSTNLLSASDALPNHKEHFICTCSNILLVLRGKDVSQQSVYTDYIVFYLSS